MLQATDRRTTHISATKLILACDCVADWQVLAEPKLHTTLHSETQYSANLIYFLLLKVHDIHTSSVSNVFLDVISLCLQYLSSCSPCSAEFGEA